MHSEFRRSTAKKSDFTRRFLLVTAFGLFGAAAAVGMVSQNTQPQSAPVVQHIAERLPLPDLEELVSAADANDGLYVREERIQRGDSVATVLKRLGINDASLQRFLVNDPAARSIARLYPGRVVQAATEANGELQWLRYIHTPAVEHKGRVVQRMLEVTRTADGEYRATEREMPAERQVSVAMGTITSSLFGATDAAGVPYAVARQMVDILASDIDFFRDLRTGDQFRVVYETFTSNGLRARAGRILALEFINNGKAYQAVWFDPKVEGQSPGYFAFDGTSRRRAFLRVPLEFTRISSGFGMRKHPILNTMRGHKGIDYAAPTGTPVRTTGDGVVDFVGTQRGYGKVVIVRHHGEYSTLYAHLNGFANGLKKGSKVAQGEVVGYVGATGMATGPHLHYEFRVAGSPIDPQSADIPIAQTLKGEALARFREHVTPYQGQLNMLAQLQRLQDEGTVAAETLAMAEDADAEAAAP